VAVLRDYTVSPRGIFARLANLPDDSALSASLQGVHRGWGTNRHLLATVVDAIQGNTYVTARVAGVKRVRKPKPIPRPKTKARQKRRVVRVADLTKGASNG
jgi:hypothetical protein